jgi:membrane-associated phospholipid phosphatase
MPVHYPVPDITMRITVFSKIKVSLMIGLFLTLSVPLVVHADSPARQASSFASGSGNILYLAAGIGLPLLSDGGQGRNHSLRVLDSLGTSVLLTEGLKGLIREKRPDSNEHDSFPSGHATAAFAVATTESALHPKQSALWYLGAALISYSRVRLHRHYGRDVIAGAVIGYGVARLEVSAPHGLLLAPLITRDRHTVGLQMSQGF